MTITNSNSKTVLHFDPVWPVKAYIFPNFLGCLSCIVRLKYILSVKWYLIDLPWWRWVLGRGAAVVSGIAGRIVKRG